jgi:peptidoglycan-associated lipoprotein
MLLGGRRADNVKKVLVRFGSGTDQLKATSRGEMDATGVDEESWARDRKVRIEVAN